MQCIASSTFYPSQRGKDLPIERTKKNVPGTIMQDGNSIDRFYVSNVCSKYQF